ncbi:MAG: arylsulfatase [Candidatus Limimorpha sp.]
MKIRTAFTIGCAALCASSSCVREQQPPNVVIIMCDDMGYGDLACYGQRLIRTPNIDEMARRGMRFTQAYAGSPVSAPSRASLMTGQHTGHCEVRGNKEYWPGSPKVKYGVNEEFSVSGQHPLDPDRIVLPEILKSQGYSTAMFGKWAGGFEGSCSTPDKRGFDEFYGYICQYQAHLYFPNFLNSFSKNSGDTAVSRQILDENVLFPMFGDDYFKRPSYSADLIHEAALKWLDNQIKEQPFFAMLTYTLPHAELAQPHDSIVRYYENEFGDDKCWAGQEGSRYNPVVNTHAQFAAMITRLDCYVGEVLDKLREKGLEDNTIVFFTSDNGPHEEGGADPAFFGRDGKLRGLKRQCYEGGIRIPFIAYWKGKIKEGSESDHQLAFYDMMPTLCEIVGAECPATDGISFAPTLFDNAKQEKHDFLYWEFEETDQIAVRMDDWKMLVKSGKPYLYNLGEDIHENNDVSDLYPEIVDAMIQIIEEQHVESELFKVTMPDR